MTRSPRGTGKDGYVLISVLGVLALVTGLVTALLLLGRNALDTAVVASEALVTDAMVQSAVSLAGYQLFVLGMPPARVDGQQIRLNLGTATLFVTSEAGRVDLNGSVADLLAAAYRASGLKAMTPETFAGRVIDWRDPDDDPAENGAETQAYTAAGLPYGPRNGPFRSVDDLGWVLGISPADLAALRPFVTVFNAPGRLSAFSAPAALIRALPGVKPDTVDEVVRTRTALTDRSIATLADLLLVQAALIDTTPPRTYRVRIEVQRNGRGAKHRTSFVLAAGSTPDFPYHVLDETDDGLLPPGRGL